jgi:phage antirepressor YoqD-like protein
VTDIDLFASADNRPQIVRADTILVPFDGGPLPAVLLDGDPRVVLRPVVEAVGLDWKSQHAKLSADEAACMVLVTTQLPGDRQAREYAVVDLETFTLWLAGLQPGRVAAHARAAVVAYRKRAARVLREHFFPTSRTVAAMSPRELAELVIAEADRADAAEVRAVAAESNVRVLMPAANAWAAFLDAGRSMEVGPAAKCLVAHGVDTGRNRLYALLREWGWVFKRSREPMGAAVERGYVRLALDRPHTNPKTGEEEDGAARTRITGKGLERMADHFGVALDMAIVNQYLDQQESAA